MSKIYTSFFLVGSLMTILGTRAFCTDVLSSSDEHHKSNGHTNGKILTSVSELNLINSKTLTSDELEDMHQDLFKKQDFNGAAVALIGSALRGHTENMDYLLSIEPNALQFINKADESNISKILKSISLDLIKQYKSSRSSPQPQEFLTGNYFTESLLRNK